MNMYDEAYALAKAIKESNEMKRLKAASEKVGADEDAKKMVKEYISLQMQAHYAKLAGQKEDESIYKKLQETAIIVSNNELAQEYLQALISWNQIAADLQKIVAEAMSQGLDILDLKK